MTTTVYTICWNEIQLLPHFFKHYNWADKIVVYDNGSDDGSQDFVVSQPKGELRHYDTKNEQDNIVMSQVKNTCWKGDQSDWVVVCDVDEFVVGYEKLLEYVGQLLIFRCVNWEMVTESFPEDFSKVTTKFHHARWSNKCLVFNPRIEAINYGPGCHWCRPIPDVRIRGVLDYYHFATLGEDYLVKRWQRYAPRMSQSDKDRHWAGNYLLSEEEIRKIYRERVKLIKAGTSLRDAK